MLLEPSQLAAKPDVLVFLFSHWLRLISPFELDLLYLETTGRQDPSVQVTLFEGRAHMQEDNSLKDLTNLAIIPIKGTVWSPLLAAQTSRDASFFP